MALPQDGQNANGLTKVTEIPTGKELIFIDPTTNEGGIITLEDLTTQILNKLTSKIFTLDQGNMTLLQALNQLNSNSFRCAQIDYPNSYKPLEKLNSPSLIFGTGKKLPYTLIFVDNEGDSDLRGGTSVIYGFMYEEDTHGAQIAMHYSGAIRKRNKNDNVWSEWTAIHD